MFGMQYEADIEIVGQIVVGNFSVQHIEKISRKIQVGIRCDDGLVISNAIPIGDDCRKFCNQANRHSVCPLPRGVSNVRIVLGQN